MDNISCRTISVNDYEKFHKLINDFRETKFSIEQFQDILNKSSNTDTLVLEINNELVATGKVLYEYKFIFNTCCLAHIEDVCVKKEYRNKGLGKYMINELVKIATTKKCYKIVLDCSDDNRSFYEKCKFERRGNQMSLLLSQI
jgi:glucosamine-phosphate N-acetyltransferase